jgi:hypothetical protein
MVLRIRLNANTLPPGVQRGLGVDQACGLVEWAGTLHVRQDALWSLCVRGETLCSAAVLCEG